MRRLPGDPEQLALRQRFGLDGQTLVPAEGELAGGGDIERQRRVLARRPHRTVDVGEQRVRRSAGIGTVGQFRRAVHEGWREAGMQLYRGIGHDASNLLVGLAAMEQLDDQALRGRCQRIQARRA